MTDIVVAHLSSAAPSDRPLVLLGGVPVPARSVLIERRPRPQRLPGDPPDLRAPARGVWGEEYDVVLEIRAEPRSVDNDATVEVTRRPAKPYSGEAHEGYVCVRNSSYTVELTPAEDEHPGSVTVYLGQAPGGVLGSVTLHRDEVLTFAAELIALAGDPS